MERVRALYGYEAEINDELTFEEGAIIYVTAKNEDGWWEGKCDGQTGTGSSLGPNIFLSFFFNYISSS